MTVPTSLPPSAHFSSELPSARLASRWSRSCDLSTLSLGAAVAVGLAPGVAVWAGASVGACVGALVGACVGALVGSDVGSAVGAEVCVASGVASTTVSTGEGKGDGRGRGGRFGRRRLGGDRGLCGGRIVLGDRAGSQRSGVEAGADHAYCDNARGHAHPWFRHPP